MSQLHENERTITATEINNVDLIGGLTGLMLVCCSESPNCFLNLFYPQRTSICPAGYDPLMLRPWHVSNCFELLNSVAEEGWVLITYSKEETTYKLDLAIVNIHVHGHI